MSYDQKPPRMRVVDGNATDRRRSEATGPLRGGFGAGPAPRRVAGKRPAIKAAFGRGTIALLFLSAALIGGVAQAWLLLRS